jgi:NAD(P)-dependent dehydrogenase (short-subunit alcohol dehydrogenase family)
LNCFDARFNGTLFALCIAQIKIVFGINTNRGEENIFVSNGTNKLLVGALFGLGAAAALRSLRKKQRQYDFQNKVVLITGGSRGLGLVLARQLADEGARIAICARNSEELKRARADLHSRNAEVLDVVCDLRNQVEVNEMIEAVRSRYGRIDVLINNAGVIQVGPLELQTEEDFREAMNIHFWAPFYTMQAVLPEMRERGEGRIVNIASIGGKIPVPHLVPYCASKFALVGLSSAMRAELIKDNIFVTTVCPGLMRTGSPVNALFKGQNEKEYAWFTIGDSLPITSISAENAASQIIEAAGRGDAELVISIQAQLATKFYGLFPGFTSEINALVNHLLPAPGGIGKAKTRGKESGSWLAPSILTALSDYAAVKNNELKPNEQAV